MDSLIVPSDGCVSYGVRWRSNTVANAHVYVVRVVSILGPPIRQSTVDDGCYYVEFSLKDVLDRDVVGHVTVFSEIYRVKVKSNASIRRKNILKIGLNITVDQDQHTDLLASLVTEGDRIFSSRWDLDEPDKHNVQQ